MDDVFIGLAVFTGTFAVMTFIMMGCMERKIREISLIKQTPV